MKKHGNAFNGEQVSAQASLDYFNQKLACETDCSDVYQDIINNDKDYYLLDVRSPEAYAKSHATSAINLPHAEINAQSMQEYPIDSQFVVYCWGPGCNGASKAAAKLSALGFRVKEMIGGIHYWEDFERYPVRRRSNQAQS